MKQTCDMLPCDAEEELEENSLWMGCPLHDSVGSDGFFTDEDEIVDDREEFLTTGGNENPAVNGKANNMEKGSHSHSVKSLSEPIDIIVGAESEWTKTASSRRANAKATQDWREKAWERKRDQVLLEGFCGDDMSEQSKTLAHQEFGEVVIDSPRSQKQALKGGPRARSYLTDVDIDELKGCLDLGFGFNHQEMPELSHTLPALELCYAFAHNFQDRDHQKSSPVSTPDRADSTHCDSYAQSPIANWKISSPGDSPQEVKARLKVWAQAVACTVRLCS